ncbi:dynamin family protein [Streptomyces sp. NPDC091281]|uniref:dynamin family protein n=1 Tax=Streptomyces sp. NPDC091281 TaxID=3365985 RepID=UPI00381BE8F6
MTASAHPQDGARSARDLPEVITDVVALARAHMADETACVTLEGLARRWRSPRLPVVVVGEVSRGKSSLVNALIGRALLPEGFQPLSSSWVRLSHGPQPRATAVIRRADGTLESVALDVEQDLPDYLTVKGGRRLRARHGNGSSVTYIDMEVPAPLLESGLELIDTPGVGGLEPAHLRAALSALIEADAVLFVTKPGEPISRSEREFLAVAVERVSACVIVQTHRDQASDPGAALRHDLDLLGDVDQWRALLEAPGEPAETVEERARALADRLSDPAFAVSVSARNALAAAAEGDPGRRRALLEASNLGALEEVLETEIVAAGHRIHRANVRNLAENLLQEIRRPAAQRIAMLRGDADALEAIEEREARIDRWVAHNGDYWRLEFDESGGRLLTDLARDGASRSVDLSREYRQAFAQRGAKGIREMMPALLEEPQTALAELTRTARLRTRDDVDRVRQLLDRDGLGEPLARMEQTRTVFERLADQGDLDATSAFDPDLLIKVLQGGIAATTVTATAVVAAKAAGVMSFSAAVPVFWPFVAGAGLFMGVSHWRKKRARTVEEAKEVLATVCREIETTAVTRTTEAVQDARAQLKREIQDALAETAARVARDRRELEESSTLTAEEREAAVARAEEDLRGADELLRELGALAAE